MSWAGFLGLGAGSFLTGVGASLRRASLATWPPRAGWHHQRRMRPSGAFEGSAWAPREERGRGRKIETRRGTERLQSRSEGGGQRGAGAPAARSPARRRRGGTWSSSCRSLRAGGRAGAARFTLEHRCRDGRPGQTKELEAGDICRGTRGRQRPEADRGAEGRPRPQARARWRRLRRSCRRKHKGAVQPEGARSAGGPRRLCSHRKHSSCVCRTFLEPGLPRAHLDERVPVRVTGAEVLEELQSGGGASDRRVSPERRTCLLAPAAASESSYTKRAKQSLIKAAQKHIFEYAADAMQSARLVRAAAAERSGKSAEFNSRERG